MKFFSKFYTILIVLLCLLSIGNEIEAQNNFFSPASYDDLSKSTKATKAVKKMGTFQLDESAMRQYLKKAPMEFKGGTPIPLEIPLPNGTTETFEMVESPILAPNVAALYPDIKTFAGRGLKNKTASIRLSLTSSGFSAVLLNVEGDVVYFEPYSKQAPNVYFNYFSRDAIVPKGFQKSQCKVGLNGHTPKKGSKPGIGNQKMTGENLRTFRLAMAGTGEFTANHGGTSMGGFNAIVDYVNEMTATYRNELSVSFMLVSTASIVYADPNTDPYTQSDEDMMLTENQMNLDAVIGSANYDVGHLMGANPAFTSPSGLASLGVVCDNGFKAQGWTKEADPMTYSNLFNLQVLFHEVGHMFGMHHSYNSNISICTTRNQPTSVEPGSGASIMSYGFTCDDDDYFQSTQIGPLLHYHTISYSEAVAFLSTISCDVSTVTNNNPPVVTMPSNVTIPKSTPFSLTGSATDPDGDPLTYSWEGTNVGTIANPDINTLDDPSLPPFFRTYEPTTSPTRTFPLLSAILDGTNQARGDKLPSVGFVTTHRLTARDNNMAGGGVSFGEVTVTVDGNIGPFLETTNLAATYPGASTQTITWDVNGTDAATPTINILLSTDGGMTFPTTLASATPNDGSEMITLPNITTNTGRIKVEAVGNIFFDISNADFSIAAVAACNISAITVANLSACNPATNTFTADVTVTFSDAPATGNLVLSGDGSETIAVTGLTSPHTFTGVSMSADGGAISLTATFDAAAPACTFTNSNAGTAPASCSVMPPPTAVPTMGEWGLITFALLMMCFGLLFMMNTQPKMAGFRGSTSMSGKFNYLPFVKNLYQKTLAFTMIGLAVVFAVSIAFFGYEMTNADLPGSLIAGPVFAYLIHLMLLFKQEEQ